MCVYVYHSVCFEMHATQMGAFTSACQTYLYIVFTRLKSAFGRFLRVYFCGFPSIATITSRITFFLYFFYYFTLLCFHVVEISISTILFVFLFKSKTIDIYWAVFIYLCFFVLNNFSTFFFQKKNWKNSRIDIKKCKQ